MTVLGCYETGLYHLKNNIANYQPATHNAYWLITWAGSWDIHGLAKLLYVVCSLVFFRVNWAIAALGGYERRRLEKKPDDLENAE